MRDGRGRIAARVPAGQRNGAAVNRRGEGQRRGRAFTGVALVALILTLAGPALASGRAAPRASALTSAINRVMRRASIPGAIVGVWQRHRDPYIRAFGVRNTVTGRPMGTDLHMRIGSETKTFTVTALLQLVDQRKVRLDDPISKYVAGVPDGDEITLRELAGMRSGLFDYLSNPAFLHAWLSHSRRHWTPRQLLTYSFSKPLEFPPGTRYAYVNTNTVLLGLVVQKVSHQPLAVYIRRHILKPLRLAHTSLPVGAAFPFAHAQGYTNRSPECLLTGHQCNRLANTTTWSSSWAWAAGAMVSTLGDLHRWARAVATGRLLSRATQKQRLRFLPTGAKGFAYGLGLMKLGGWIGHSGLLPGYESLTVYLPSEHATLVVLINFGPGTGHLPVFRLGHAITKVISPRHVITLG
jgi:D-alanyl-D-alanine carboxypeptidase